MKTKIAFAFIGVVATLACFSVFSEDSASQTLFQPKVTYEESLFLKFITEEHK